jgi:hypothetical protein
MEQSLYFIGNDSGFFESPNELIPIWSENIEKHCKTEKASFVFDPLAVPTFLKLKHNDKELKRLIVAYYSYFENNYSAQLSWGELDSESVQYIDSLYQLMYNLENKDRSLCAYGTFPLTYESIKMHLYYFINPYLMEDFFYLISEKDFVNNYALIIETDEMLEG